jgi:TPR repeat protein
LPDAGQVALAPPISKADAGRKERADRVGQDTTTRANRGRASRGSADPAVVPARAGDSPADARPKDDLEIFLKRGDEMLAAKDVAEARKFYGYAAVAGNARAAIALARTYEPGYSVPSETNVKADQKAAAALAEPVAERPQPEARRPRPAAARTAMHRHQMPRRVNQFAVVSHTPVPFFQRIGNTLRDLFNR